MRGAVKNLFNFRVVILVLVVAVVGLVASSVLRNNANKSAKNVETTEEAKEAAERKTASKASESRIEAQNIFILQDNQQSGCLVCHGDPKLTKIVDGKPKSFYVDVNQFKDGPHKKVACSGCHKDFNNSNHVQKSVDWRAAASLSCIRCKQHNQQYIDYSKSIHGQLALQAKTGKGGAQPPACGTCHSGHDIKKLKKNPAEKAKLRANAKMVCGDCHSDSWKSYDDYYHGRAFKSGATDAPSCWDCHGYHGVQPKNATDSMVNAENLPKTCDKCHTRSTEAFTSYAKLIHGTQDERKANFVYAGIDKIFSTVSGTISGLFSSGSANDKSQ